MYHCLVMARVAPFVGEVSARARPHTKLIALLALGHCVVDINQGALPAVLPFLKAAHGLSYAQAATIATLLICALLPLVGFAAARFLPAPREQRSA